MKPLFESTDGNGDSVKVHPWSTPAGSHQFLAVQVLQGLDDSVALLSRSEVVKLYDVLGTWLGEDPAPDTPASGTAARAHALSEAVKLAGLMSLTVPEILEHATTFEEFIRIGYATTPEAADGAPEPEAAVTADISDDVWGSYCVRCGHSSGIHTTGHGCNSAVGGDQSCSCPGAVLAEVPPQRSGQRYCTCVKHDHVMGRENDCATAGCWCTSPNRRPRG
jgi:hypothetical protein